MGRRAPSPPEEDVYDIAGLLQYEKRDGQDYYLVEWKGYSVDDATWEPRENFLDPVPEIVARMKALKEEYERNNHDNTKRKSQTRSEAEPSGKRARVSKASKRDTKKAKTKKDVEADDLDRLADDSFVPNSTAADSAENIAADFAGHHADSTTEDVTAVNNDDALHTSSNIRTQQPHDQIMHDDDEDEEEEEEEEHSLSQQQKSAQIKLPSPEQTASESQKMSREVDNTAADATSLADVPGGSSSSRSNKPAPVIADDAPPEYSYVRAMRKDPMRGISAIMLRGPEDSGPGLKVPVRSVRYSHSQALIDFLLERIQFKSSSRS